MSKQDQELLQQQVDSIARDLDKGWTYEQDEYGEYRTEDGDVTSPYDYVCEALDINYRVNSRGEYLSAEILVTFGGPNIWVHTTGRVEGFWWGSHATASFDAPELDDAARELYESTRP